MRKTFCMLLAMCCLTILCIASFAKAEGIRDASLQASFESNSLKLAEMQLISDYTGYTLRASAAAYAQLIELDSTVPSYPAEGDWVTLELNSQEFHPTPCFFSPDGSKAILMDEEHVYLLQDKTITVILPNYMRGVRDEYGSLSHFTQIKPSQWVNTEGITWSPDGRYAALANYKIFFVQMKCQGLYILDTESGEVFLADTYPTKISDGAASVFQACFDQSGETLYYMLYGNIYQDSRVSLMSYSMKTGEKQRLYACQKNSAYPKLKLDSKGRLLNLTDSTRGDEFLGLNVLEQKDGAWTMNAYSFSQPAGKIRPQYMDIGSAGMGILLQTALIQGRQITLPARFSTDEGFSGYDELLLIEGADAQAATVLPLPQYGDGSELADRILKGEVLRCLNIQLSPDGYYALLLVTDGKTYDFLMMDLQTLALKKVQVPAGTASLRAGCGLPQSAAYPLGFGWFEGNKLVILTENGVKQYEFVN